MGIYIQYVYSNNCGVSFWTCLREISGDRVALFGSKIPMEKTWNFVMPLETPLKINLPENPPKRYGASPDGWAVWGVVVSTRWWLLVDHCVLRNWDRILVSAVKGLISRAGTGYVHYCDKETLNSNKSNPKRYGSQRGEVQHSKSSPLPVSGFSSEGN